MGIPLGKLRLVLATLIFGVYSASLAADVFDKPLEHGDPAPSMQIGAEVYSQRCTLCHGAGGMGEGILPIKLKDYPDTNLLTNAKTVTRDEVYEATVYGGYKAGLDQAMPPYGQELTWTELQSVTDFVIHLRNSPEEARAMIISRRAAKLPEAQQGKEVFDTRCVLCHGKYGEGDGRMAKILKDPPPFDLTASRMPAAYLEQIIVEGGEALGRSKHMPPWGDQLTDSEVDAVVSYLITIRD